MRILWAMVGLALALAACASEADPHARTDGSCFIGGCSHEVCSDRPGAISPCLWFEAYACYRTASCERQSDGACGWTATPELTECLAAHDPVPVSHP